MNTLQLLALQAWQGVSNEGLLVLDSQGTIQLINPSLRELLKLKKQPASLDEFLTQTDTSMPELRALLTIDHTIDHAQWGSLCIQKYPQRYLHWQQIPLVDNDQMVGSLTVFRDPAAQSQLEVTRQSFLSMVSHDLRTPLSTILGFAELLYNNRGNLSDEEQTEFLEHIIKNANELNLYTQIALDILFLESNVQNFELEPVSLDHFVKHWLSDALHRFPEDRLVLHNGLPPGSLIANVAPSALHKILYIMVDFALQESLPDDKVDIRVEHQESKAHILIQYRAPHLNSSDIAMLFRLMQPRDINETGRPHLHRMQLYVANLLAERQQGYLTLRGRANHRYQMDLVLPLPPTPHS